MRKGAFLLLMFLFGTAEDCDTVECSSSLDCAAAGRASTCVIPPNEDKGICAPLGQETAVLGAYLNKRAAACAVLNHDFTWGPFDKRGKPKTHRFEVKPGCWRVWESRTCKRCRSDVPISMPRWEGDCEEFKKVCPE